LARLHEAYDRLLTEALHLCGNLANAGLDKKRLDFFIGGGAPEKKKC